MSLYCPLNGLKLEKIGTNKGQSVYWCENSDAIYQATEHTRIVLGVNPKCPHVWASASVSEQARTEEC
jgi:hypothetical protein